MEELEKRALIERLVRLGATDVPKTPRWVMRHRSPEELASLQRGVTGAMERVKAPIQAKADALASKLPKKLQAPARALAKFHIDNPETLALQVVPIPGISMGAVAAKKGLEKLIDRVAPMKLAFSTNEYSGPMNPIIQSGASSLPSLKPANLKSVLQKAAEAKKEDKHPNLKNLVRFGLGTGLGKGLNVGGRALGRVVLNAKEDPGLYRKLKATAKVPIVEREPFPYFDTSPYFGPAGRQTGPHIGVSGPVPGHLAHELGHASIHASRLGRLVQSPVSRGLAAAGTGPLAFLGGAATGALTDDPAKQRTAVLAPLVLNAPVLAYEAGASLLGMKRLHGLGATRKQLLEAAKPMVLGFDTYAARAGAGMAGAYAGVGAGNFVRRMGREKTASELYPELTKLADELSIGHWWETVGGPFLAKGGSHTDFQKMMAGAGIPKNVQDKFMRVAKEKYPSGYNTPGSGGGSIRSLWNEALAKNSDRAGYAGALGLGAYLLAAPKKEDPNADYASWKGRLGAHLGITLPAVYHASEFGRLRDMAHPTRGWRTIGGRANQVGFGLLAALPAIAVAEAARSPLVGSELERQGRNAVGHAGLERRVERDASHTDTYQALKSVIPAASNLMLPYLMTGSVKGTGRAAAVGALEALGMGMATKRDAKVRYEAMKEKSAAGAPTRGNFMMASELPPFTPARLDKALQKDGDFLPDGVTYNPEDFKKSKYAMSREQMGAWVDYLLKEAVGPTPASRLETTMRVGAPKAAAPPGPSIASLSKPKGKTFGRGIPGALKTAL